MYSISKALCKFQVLQHDLNPSVVASNILQRSGRRKEKETNQQEGADQIGRDGIFISSFHLSDVGCKQLCGTQDVQYLDGKEIEIEDDEITG